MLNSKDRLISLFEIEEKEMQAVFQKLHTEDKPACEDFDKIEEGLVSAGLLPRLYPVAGWRHLTAGNIVQAIRYGYSLLFLENTAAYSQEGSGQIIYESKREAYRLLFSAFIDAKSKTHALALINQAEEDGFDLKKLGVEASVVESASDEGTEELVFVLKENNVVESFHRLVNLEHNVVVTESNILIREKGLGRSEAVSLVIESLKERFGVIEDQVCEEVANG